MDNRGDCKWQGSVKIGYLGFVIRLNKEKPNWPKNGQNWPK